MADELGRNVKFMGNQKRRDEAVRFVNSVLAKKGNFPDFIDLTGGVDSVSDRFVFHIIDDDDSFAVKVASLTDDPTRYRFIIDKESGTIYKPMDELKPDQGDESVDFLDDV
jgi:hypothetical protein